MTEKRGPPSTMPATGLAEIAAVVGTGLLHLLAAEVLHVQGPFVAVALLGWGGWIGWRVRSDPAAAAAWGLRGANLRPALLATSGLGVGAVLVMAGIALSRGTFAVPPHLLTLGLLYPLWGLLQQLLVQGLVARNLVRARWPRPVVVAVCGILFGLVHLPDAELTIATAGLGFAFTPIWLRWRNVWPLGLWHGWLGAFFYVWVLGRNPWLSLAG